MMSDAVHILVKAFSIVFVLATGAAWGLFGSLVGLSVGLGFATMAANTWLTRRTVRQFTSGARTTLVGLYLFKMVILFGLLFVFLKVFGLDVIGLVVGLSLPMMVMIFAGNRWMAMEESEEATDDSANPAHNGVS